MDRTERTIKALTTALADALHNREQRPVDYKLISAVRSANEELRRLAALVPNA